MDAETAYAAYHAPRFAYLLRILDPFVTDREARILDVGPSPLSNLLRGHFGRPIDTLGIDESGGIGGGRYIRRDLNELSGGEAPDVGIAPYDVIVMAEVIEHLSTAPSLVLAFLKKLLREGGVLLLQTPNAASLPKRVKLLLGRNPYEMIRENRRNPGHFREYTLRELKRLAVGAGFRIEHASTRFYFDARYARHDRSPARLQPLVGTLKNVFYRALPSSLREGITLVVRNQSPPNGI